MIENTGNALLDLTIRVNPELTTWTMKLVMHQKLVVGKLIWKLPGQSGQVTITVQITVAERNDENKLVIKTSQDISNFIINETKLVVKDEIGLEISSPDDGSFGVTDGDFSSTKVQIENTGIHKLA